MKTYSFITAILLLAAINCSAQSAQQIRRKQQQKTDTKSQTVAGTKLQTSVNDSLAKEKTSIKGPVSPKSLIPPFYKNKNTVIPDSLRPKTTPLKKKQ